jgi:hypothetical protein
MAIMDLSWLSLTSVLTWIGVSIRNYWKSKEFLLRCVVTYRSKGMTMAQDLQLDFVAVIVGKRLERWLFAQSKPCHRV